MEAKKGQNNHQLYLTATQYLSLIFPLYMFFHISKLFWFGNTKTQKKRFFLDHVTDRITQSDRFPSGLIDPSARIVDLLCEYNQNNLSCLISFETFDQN